jgi:hypothetical protein
MNYQALILGAGSSLGAGEIQFQKSQFLADGSKSLLEVSSSSYHSALKIVLALNPADFEYFSDMRLNPNIELKEILYPTQGALATAGMCLDTLLDDIPIIVSAIDGVCLKQIDPFFNSMLESESEGGVIVFPSNNVNYCYVRVHKDLPIEFAEKRKIGQLATAGIYFFKNKKILESSILWAILNQIKHNDMYYFSSVMNKLVFENKKIKLFEIMEEEYLRFSTKEEALVSRKRLMGDING